MSLWVSDWGGGGNCPGGKCLGGICPGGTSPGGTCRGWGGGGLCPRTILRLFGMMS